jgi:peptide/nickel transport system permease protein
VTVSRRLRFRSRHLSPSTLPSEDFEVAAHRHRFVHPLLAYVLRRLAAALGLLLIVSILIFLGTEVLPGDAATAVLGRNSTPEAYKIVRAQLGLEKPMPQRYVEWLGGVLTGDLGESLGANEPVTKLIGYRIRNSAILALGAIIVMFPLAIALGIVAGTRVGRPTDHMISGVSLALIAAPEFVTGTLLILLLAVKLTLFPPVSLVPSGTSPLDQPSILVLPILTLTVVGLAYLIRMVRAGVMAVMESDYAQMARLHGLSERRVILNHALRNALAPTVQVTALTLQWLVGGIFIVEIVFGYPGIGQGLVQAVTARDIPLVQSVALLLAALYIGINIVADVIVILLIPKLRTAQ